MSVRKAKPAIKAENEQSFAKAREEYRLKAKALFDPCPYGGPEKGWTNADELRRLFKTLNELMDKGVCSAKPFTDEICGLLVTILTLDRVIAYNGRFSEDSEPVRLVGESDETHCRNELLLALFDYCVRSAVMAQEHKAHTAREYFVEAIADMEMSGFGLSLWFRVCTAEQARAIVERIERGTCLLWSELLVNQEEKRLRDKPEPDVPLGAYARKVVEFCNFSKGRIKFKGGETLVVPQKSQRACKMLRKLLESSDPDGHEHLERNWHSHFVRKDARGNTDPESHMTRLRYHIFAEPVAKGGRGTGRFRLKAKVDMKAINALRLKYGQTA